MRLRFVLRRRRARGCRVGRAGPRLKPPGQSSRRIALYLSAHGFGHAVRAAAVVAELAALADIRITVIAPGERPRVWPDSLAPITDDWIVAPTDVGVVQTDDVTVDIAATTERIDQWLSDLPAIVRRETERLARGFDLVIGDVPPPPFAAAEAVGIPGVAVANFTWDWIYRELGFEAAADRSAESYARATLLLEAIPFGPMPAFPRRTNVGLVARAPTRARAAAREHLALGDGDSAVLIAFQPAYSASLELPAPRAGRRFFTPPGWRAAGRPDVDELGADRTFEDALAAADVVVGKPGYGLIGDVERAGARFLYVPRPGFPENMVLERHLESRGGTLPVAAATLAGDWDDELGRIESADRPAAKEAGGAKLAAMEIAKLLAVDSGVRAV